MIPPKHTVRILVSITDYARFDACTLVLNSIRVGFPTARILVDINPVGDSGASVADRIEAKAKAGGVTATNRLRRPTHHAEWIRTSLELHGYDGPLIICDPDVVFWKSVEDWDFGDKLMAGYYVPQIWNEFAKAVSYPRIHTSMMWFPDVKKLFDTLKELYPYSHSATGDYCPCDPFMPATRFIAGFPFFWDSCANLYQMLGFERCGFLEKAHLECFDHLNSASFYDVMVERMENPTGFKIAHNELVRNPAALKGVTWPQVDAYYNACEHMGQIILNGYYERLSQKS